MGAKHAIVERLLSAVFLGTYIFFVVPNWHPTSAIGSILFVLGAGIIAYSLAKFLTEEKGTEWLIVVGVVAVALTILFTTNPGGLI